MSVLTSFLLVPFYWLLEIFYFVFRCRPRKSITGQHVLVTGAAQGIGAAFARQFAAMGNTVHCVDVDSELLETAVGDLRKQGYRAHSYTCDLTSLTDVERMCSEVKGSCDMPITILVNNAGVAFARSLPELTLTQIQHALTVNMVSNHWLIQQFLPDMIRLDQGFIINIASMAGLLPVMDSTDYCAAKAASVHTIRQLAHMYCGTNINFTAVCPWFVQTKMIRGIEKFVSPISAEEVAHAGIVAAQEGKEVVVVPRRFWLMIRAYNCAPSRLLKAMVARRSPKVTQLLGEHFVGQEMEKKIK